MGRWLVPLLAERGHQVLVLSRNPRSAVLILGEQVEFCRGDLHNIPAWRETLASFKAEAVVHLAWEGLPDYSYEMCRRNLDHSIDLFALVGELEVPILLSTGSCWEYASRHGQLAEDDALGFPAVFPAVKNSLRLIGEAIGVQSGTKFYWLRLFFVYGPGQRSGSLIPHIIESVRKGVPPQLKAPHNRNDFVYVGDVAHAISQVIELSTLRS